MSVGHFLHAFGSYIFRRLLLYKSGETVRISPPKVRRIQAPNSWIFSKNLDCTIRSWSRIMGEHFRQKIIAILVLSLCGIRRTKETSSRGHFASAKFTVVIRLGCKGRHRLKERAVHPFLFSYLGSRTAKPSTKTKWRTSDFASVSKQNGRSNRTAPQQILVEFSNQATTFFTPFDFDHFTLLCIATPMLIFQEANKWDLAWFAS